MPSGETASAGSRPTPIFTGVAARAGAARTSAANTATQSLKRIEALLWEVGEEVAPAKLRAARSRGIDGIPEPENGQGNHRALRKRRAACTRRFSLETAGR